MNAILTLFLITVSLQVTSQKLYQINTPVGYTLRATSIMDMEMSMDEKSKPTVSKTKSYFRLIAIKVNEKDIDFNMIIDSITLTVTDKGKTKTANSNKPETFKDDEKLSRTLEAVGQELKVKIGKNGKLIKDEMTPQMAEYCVLEFGDKPISVGDEWLTSQELNSYGLKTTTNTKNKLESIDNGILKIWSVSQNDFLGPEPVSAYMLAFENSGLLKNYECSVTMKMFGTMVMKIHYSAEEVK